MHTNKTLEEELITAFSGTIELFGLTTLESRLFAYLYLINEPKTLDEMGEALGKSKTAMSTSIRSLASLHLVTPVWKKGTRKDLYIANQELYKRFINFYFRKWVDKTEQQKGILEELRDGVEENSSQSNEAKELKRLMNRLDEIIEFHQQIEVTFNKLRQER